MKKTIKSLCVIVMAVFFLIGCGTKKNNQKTEGKVKLDPENPVSIRVWHYYITITAVSRRHLMSL